MEESWYGLSGPVQVWWVRREGLLRKHLHDDPGGGQIPEEAAVGGLKWSARLFEKVLEVGGSQIMQDLQEAWASLGLKFRILGSLLPENSF